MVFVVQIKTKGLLLPANLSPRFAVSRGVWRIRWDMVTIHSLLCSLLWCLRSGLILLVDLESRLCGRFLWNKRKWVRFFVCQDACNMRSCGSIRVCAGILTRWAFCRLSPDCSRILVHAQNIYVHMCNSGRMWFSLFRGFNRGARNAIRFVYAPCMPHWVLFAYSAKWLHEKTIPVIKNPGANTQTANSFYISW